MFTATGRYRCIRAGEAASNDYGDPIDPAPATVWSDRPGRVTEVARTVPDATSGSLVRTSRLVGRFAPRTDLAVGDLIVDGRTGDRFEVTAVHRPAGSLLAADTLADLMTSAATPGA